MNNSYAEIMTGQARHSARSILTISFYNPASSVKYVLVQAYDFWSITIITASKLLQKTTTKNNNNSEIIQIHGDNCTPTFTCDWVEWIKQVLGVILAGRLSWQCTGLDCSLTIAKLDLKILFYPQDSRASFYWTCQTNIEGNNEKSN